MASSALEQPFGWLDIVQEVLAHATAGYRTIRHFIRHSKAVHTGSGHMLLNTAKKNVLFSTNCRTAAVIVAHTLCKRSLCLLHTGIRLMVHNL